VLDPVVADRASRVEAVGDVGLRQVCEMARLPSVVRPDTGIAVGF
jgi:hypothetical protein